MALLCIAHRGASGHRPENTLAAFREALALGCRWVELDVHGVEGELVVIHDDTLERTTNGTGEVRDKTLAEIRTLDAGDGERIPLLREVITLIDRRAVINVELKGPDTAGLTCDLLEEYFGQGWQPDDFLVSSFQHEQLHRVRELDPRIPVGALFGRNHPPSVAACQALDAYSMNVGLRGVTRELVEEAHRAALKLLVYTVNSEEEIRGMHALGVDGVFTNYPDRVFRLMQEVGDGG